MQYTIKKSFLICTLALGLAGNAFANNSQDVVVGPGKEPVRGERFGNCVHTKWESASDPCASAAAPVKKAEKPAPVEAQQPVTQLQREALTIYFDFNKAVVTQASAAKLDAIADAVRHSPKVTKVDIVGYTDKIGTEAYNDKLSVARAKAVKAYLDKQVKIDVSVLGLKGLGEKNPVTSCKKAKSRKQKITCMAKDRRVEIEFEFQK